MEAAHGLHLEQREEEIRGMQCVHSNAAMKFFPSWNGYWTLADIEETDQSYNVFCNQTNGDVTLIFTVGRK